MNNNLEKSVHGLFQLISFQFAARIVTFICNIVINRLSDYRMLGILQDMDLLHGSLLFLSREMIRMALLRNSTVNDDIQLQINASFSAFVIFTSLSIGFGYVAQQHSLLFILAAGLEILTEPLYIFCQSKLLYSIRVVFCIY
jgi:hypothetical protein